MVDISRYALNGTCFFEDILHQRTFRRNVIGEFCGFYCYINLQKETVNNREVVYPIIWVNTNNKNMTVKYYFKILKSDGSSGIIEEKRIVLKTYDTLCGPKINLETLEDEGYLENGGLRMEYGFHVESFRDYYGLQHFNFGNPFFNGDYCNVKVLNFDGTKQFYGHKHIFAFHYNTTNDEIIFRNRSGYIINYLLQIAHGVRKQVQCLPFYYSDKLTIIDILRCAVHYNLPNVTRVIEMEMATKKYFFDEEVFEMAVFWNLPHLLAQILKESQKDFVISKITDYCKKPEILERMSGESMKQLMKFLLDY